MKKHQQKNGSKKRRWFPRRKPKHMTDAKAMGITKEIDRLQRKISHREAEQKRAIQESIDRQTYHALRCAEADRVHNSKSANDTGEPTRLQPTSHV